MLGHVYVHDRLTTQVPLHRPRSTLRMRLLSIAAIRSATSCAATISSLGASRSILPDTLANIERHAPGGALHLRCELSFSPRELIDDFSNATVQLEGKAIHVELVKVVVAAVFHGLARYRARLRVVSF